MIALAIVALSVPALLLTLNQQIDGTAYLRDRSLAQMVAANRLTELRLALRQGSGQRLNSNLSGSETLANRDWFWTVSTQNTEVPGFSRIEVQVRGREADDAPALHTIVAFVSLEGEPGA